MEVSAPKVAHGAQQFCLSNGGKLVERGPRVAPNLNNGKTGCVKYSIISQRQASKQRRLLFRAGIPYLYSHYDTDFSIRPRFLRVCIHGYLRWQFERQFDCLGRFVRHGNRARNRQFGLSVRFV